MELVLKKGVGMFKRKLSADKLKKQTDKQIKVNFKEIVNLIDEGIHLASKEGAYNLKVDSFEMRHKYFIYEHDLILNMLKTEYLNRGFVVEIYENQLRYHLSISWDGKENERNI